MNYIKAYVNLMRKASNQPTPRVYEKHHVFPKSIYSKNNYVVKLSPKQHYVAHALLYRGFVKRYGADHPKTKKMFFALLCMYRSNSNNRYINSRNFEVLRTKYSELMKGNDNPMRKGGFCEEVRRKKLSEKMSGESNPFYGKNHSPEARQKISENLRKFYSANDSPLKGKPLSEETKQKLREARLGTKLSDQHRQKIAKAGQNKKWFNNGHTETKASECPTGFVVGRLKRTKSKP